MNLLIGCAWGYYGVMGDENISENKKPSCLSKIALDCRVIDGFKYSLVKIIHIINFLCQSTEVAPE